MAREEGVATNTQSKKVARRQGPSPFAEIQNLCNLSGLPTWALQHVLQILGDSEVLRIRSVSRGVATAAGPLIQELRVALSLTKELKAGGQGGTLQLNRGRAGFCSLFHMVDNVHKLDVNIVNITYSTTDLHQKMSGVIRDFLTKFMSQPSLRDFKLRSQSRRPLALVLRLLPACADNLEALALQIPEYNHDMKPAQRTAEADALEGVVQSCHFPRLQAMSRSDQSDSYLEGDSLDKCEQCWCTLPLARGASVSPVLLSSGRSS